MELVPRRRWSPFPVTATRIIQHVDIKFPNRRNALSAAFLFGHVTRCRSRKKIKHQNNEIKKEHHREKDQHVNRPSFRHGSHCSIGPGPELGQVQWRDRRYFHWFNKYHRARSRSRWPDLGDPRPCSRREAGREHPGRRPGPPSGRRRCRRKQRQRESFCDAVLRK
jgi:hypothetical protein